MTEKREVYQVSDIERHAVELTSEAVGRLAQMKDNRDSWRYTADQFYISVRAAVDHLDAGQPGAARHVLVDVLGMFRDVFENDET